jgi:hypothetical protein
VLKVVKKKKRTENKREREGDHGGKSVVHVIKHQY